MKNMIVWKIKSIFLLILCIFCMQNANTATLHLLYDFKDTNNPTVNLGLDGSSYNGTLSSKASIRYSVTADNVGDSGRHFLGRNILHGEDITTYCMSIPRNDNLEGNSVINAGGMTVSFWYNPSAIYTGSAHNTIFKNAALQVSNDKSTWKICAMPYKPGAIQNCFYSNANFVIPNEWHYYTVAVGVLPTNNYTSFYRDGSLVNSVYGGWVSGNGANTGTGAVYIGRETEYSYCTVMYDNFRVYTGILNPAEISDLFIKETIAISPSEAALFYDFEDTNNPTANLGIDGRLYSGSWGKETSILMGSGAEDVDGNGADYPVSNVLYGEDITTYCMSIPHNDNLEGNSVVNAGGMTVSFWYNPSAIYTGSANNTIFKNAALQVSNDKSTWKICAMPYKPGAIQNCFYSNANFVIPNEWHYYTVVVGVLPTNNYTSFYRDGSLVNSVYGGWVSGNGVNTGTDNIYIGRETEYSCSTVMYDDFAVFSRALSAAEIAELFYYEYTTIPEPRISTSTFADQLPFAYYPYANKLEVAFDVTAVPNGPIPGTVHSVSIAIKQGTNIYASGVIPLNVSGKGQGTINIPENLSAGTYDVVYNVGGTEVTASKSLERAYFPWEHNTLGKDHIIYAPFEALNVLVNNQIEMVDRVYVMNFLGTMDLIWSKSKQIMAAPMELVVNTPSGKQTWTSQETNIQKMFDDLVEVKGSATGSAMSIASLSKIEEDGCVKVEWTLKPGTSFEQITNAYLDIPLKDSEVPLFHFVADTGIRLNYGGITPRGGQIDWDLVYSAANGGAVPAIWNTSGGDSNGIIWDSTLVKQHPDPVVTPTCRPFVPYVWLGATEIGLAWFGENEKGYVVNGTDPIQEVIRYNDRVILRIHIIQQPTVLTANRKIVFGLQASPTKPMPPVTDLVRWMDQVAEWCWGGYNCFSRFPDQANFEIIDKLQDVRANASLCDSVKAWVDTYAANRPSPWLERTVGGGTYTWGQLVKIEVDLAASLENQKAGLSYFEEHKVDPWYREWQIFVDEWQSEEFGRYQVNAQGESTGMNYFGNFPESYIDFALYYANEWMKRGVHIYFDNVNSKRTLNPYLSATFRNSDGTMLWSHQIWAQRDYYKRIWKLMNWWNAHSEQQTYQYQLDVTHHMTNTRMLPFNTWATITLDLEQGYRITPSEDRLPFPSDYVQAVTMGCQTGNNAWVLYPMLNQLGSDIYGSVPLQLPGNENWVLTEWAMQRVHNIRNYENRIYSPARGRSEVCETALHDFGFGATNVWYRYYWVDNPYVTVTTQGVPDDKVVWMALTKGGTGTQRGIIIVLSYHNEAITTCLHFTDGATQLVDVETKNVITVTNGNAYIDLPVEYGARVFWIER